MHRGLIQGEKPRSSDSNERRCTTPAIRLPPERGPAITEQANAFPHFCEGPRSRLLPLPSPSCDTPKRNLNSPRLLGRATAQRRPLRHGQTLAESDGLRRRLDRKSQRSPSPRDNVIGLALAPRT